LKHHPEKEFALIKSKKLIRKRQHLKMEIITSSRKFLRKGIVCNYLLHFSLSLSINASKKSIERPSIESYISKEKRFPKNMSLKLMSCIFSNRLLSVSLIILNHLKHSTGLLIILLTNKVVKKNY